MAVFRLLRLPNLFLLVTTIFIVIKSILHPAFVGEGLVVALTMKEWYLLLFIVICIGAGGYVYNDIVDQKSDDANEKRGVVGHSVTRKLALLYYIFLTVAPLLAVISLGMEQESNYYIYGYVFLVFVFWIYNQFLKRLPVIGNLTVALLCGLAVILPYFVELSTIRDLHLNNPLLFAKVSFLIFSFALFSMLANWIREMIKDIEDINGDTSAGFKTLPILIGIKATIRSTIFLSVVLLAGILYFVFTFPKNGFVIFALLMTLVPALVVLIILTYRSSEESDFGTLSNYWKLYFLFGLAGLLISSKNIL